MAETMQAAVAIGRAATHHALRALSPDGVPTDLREAQHLLDRLKRHFLEVEDATTVTLRDVHQRVKGRAATKTASELQSVMNVLVETDHVRLVRLSGEGRGQPPSPVVRLHPEYLRGRSQNSQNPASEAVEPGSESSGEVLAGIADEIRLEFELQP